MSDPAQIRREEARDGVLRFLVERDVLAHSPEAVRRGVNKEGADFTQIEIVGALLFLVRHVPAFAEEIPHAMGASKSYQATPEGVITHERNAQ